MPRPTTEEIDDVLQECLEESASQTTRFPALTYEQGVEAAIRWMQGTDANPLSD